MASPSLHSDDDSGPGESIDLKALYYAMVERAWLIALCLIASIFLTFGYLKRSPLVYAASAVLQVYREKPKILPVEDVMQEDTSDPETLRTIEKMLQSRALLERVIATNKLAEDPRFGGGEGPPPSPEQLIGRLAGMIKVGLQPGTRLISVSVEDTHRELTAQIANSVVREFVIQNYEQHSSMSDVAIEYIRADAERLRQRIEASQKRLQTFRDERNLVSLEDRQHPDVQKLNDLTAKVTEAEAQRIRLETEHAQIQRAGNDLRALLGVRVLASDPVVADAVIKVGQQEAELALVKQRYKAKHPRYIDTQGMLHEWQAKLSNALQNAVGTLEAYYVTAKQTEDEFRRAFQTQQDSVLKLIEESTKYKDLLRELQSDQERYDLMTKRINDLSMAKEWDENKIRIVQPAYVPETHFKPNKKRILLTGVLVGLAVGMGLALALEALNNTLKSPDQAEGYLKIPILSAIPTVRSAKADRRPIIMEQATENAAAESFRTMRTTLCMLGPEQDRRVFLFTSALPEEGKTFCALNFAYSLAQRGLRTLLVEADLRCPVLERALDPSNKRSLGVTDFLVHQNNLDAIVQATESPNFFYSPAGTRAPNPSELLAQEGFPLLIQEALLQFDRVVIDSAPVQPVSDTLLIVKHVQTVCLVVRAGKTPKKAALRAVHVLQKLRAPLAGFIFNRLTRLRGDHYYDYSYYGDYGKSYTEKSYTGK